MRRFTDVYDWRRSWLLEKSCNVHHLGSHHISVVSNSNLPSNLNVHAKIRKHTKLQCNLSSLMGLRQTFGDLTTTDLRVCKPLVRGTLHIMGQQKGLHI